ncbi:hypothetical protein [Corynebacterium pseudodiphtheriticum]|uniref:hypothetical protein n=1 Tax=Corynebacterium pseudodiphtheriticum TaxID=37637 RepID=UPI0025423E77|nr:hypothetical protein [Corynebacterium pseudodiphtheriticum]MDK4286916.1 hypothetical protein [Corynebacterium pseudodiphtheriticum]
MFTHPVSADFATDLHADDAIADCATLMAGTDQEATWMVSHSGKIAELIDDCGVISYSIYSDEQAHAHGAYDHIGAIADEDEKAEFLALFK